MIIGFNMKQTDFRFTFYFRGNRRTVRIEKPVFQAWLEARGFLDCDEDEQKWKLKAFIEEVLRLERGGQIVDMNSTFSRFVVNALMSDICESITDLRTKAAMAEAGIPARSALSAPSGGAV